MYSQSDNTDEWGQLIRFAGTAAPEFADSSLGGYAGNEDSGLGFNILKAVGGLVKGVVTRAIPIVGPAIGAGLDAFKKRTAGAAIQAVASNPTVQAAAVAGAKEQASEQFQKIAPYALAGLAAFILLPRLMGRRR